MAPEHIKKWLWDARNAVISTLGYPTIWWPQSNGEASALAAAFFLTATRALVGGPNQNLSVSAAWKSNPGRWKVVEALWGTDDMALSPHEVLLDFSVHNWKRKVFLITGESEVAPLHGVGDSVTTDDDYSWDFFKLLAVQSPIRLFFARVGTEDRRVTVAKRIADLERSLTALVNKWYSGQLLRPDDELGVVILSSSKEAAHASRILYLVEGKLTGTGFAGEEFPPLWKGKLKGAR